MSEDGAKGESRIVYGPEERLIRDRAIGFADRVRKGARVYPSIRQLLIKHPLSREEMEIPTAELVGSKWRYQFTRLSSGYVDLEIKKTPARAGSDLIEQVVRIRNLADPLVRSFKLSQSKGQERYENEEQAYSEVDGLVRELEALF